MITSERVIELFVYKPLSGWLINRVSRNSRAQEGTRAGTLDINAGYRKVWIDGAQYYEHRVIWLMMTGEWPENIDHKDGVRDNNIWINLREATDNENCYNANTDIGVSLHRGVSWDSERSMWRSSIQDNGQRIDLGRFHTIEMAQNKYLAAAENFHGEFAFHNRPKPFERRI